MKVKVFWCFGVILWFFGGSPFAHAMIASASFNRVKSISEFSANCSTPEISRSLNELVNAESRDKFRILFRNFNYPIESCILQGFATIVGYRVGLYDHRDAYRLIKPLSEYRYQPAVSALESCLQSFPLTSSYYGDVWSVVSIATEALAELGSVESFRVGFDRFIRQIDSTLLYPGSSDDDIFFSDYENAGILPGYPYEVLKSLAKMNPASLAKIAMDFTVGFSSSPQERGYIKKRIGLLAYLALNMNSLVEDRALNDIQNSYENTGHYGNRLFAFHILTKLDTLSEKTKSELVKIMTTSPYLPVRGYAAYILALKGGLSSEVYQKMLVQFETIDESGPIKSGKKSSEWNNLNIYITLALISAKKCDAIPLIEKVSFDHPMGDTMKYLVDTYMECLE